MGKELRGVSRRAGQEVGVMKHAIHVGATGTGLATGTVLVAADARVLLERVPTWLAVVVMVLILLVALGRIVVLLAQATIPQESKDRLEWWQTVWGRGKRASVSKSKLTE
jgi:hypothetical protein